MSQIFDDPKLKPFLDDLANESTLAKFGLTWADLAGVAKGEMSFSAFPVAADQLGHVMTLYTNNEAMPVLKMLAKVVVSPEGAAQGGHKDHRRLSRHYLHPHGPG